MAAPVLVVGGTGTVGQSVVYELLAREIPVRALVRDLDKGAAMLPGAELVQGDLADPTTLPAALAGVERAFLLTSAAEDLATLEKAFVEAAKAAGTARIVKLSTLGAAPDSALHLNRAHGEVEAALKASGMAYVIVQPSYYMQNLIGSAAQVAEGVLGGLAGDGKIAVIDTRDVADVCVLGLVDDALVGKSVAITGPEALSYAELAARLAAATGNAVEYADGDPAETKAAMLEAGMPTWFVEDLVGQQQLFRDGKGATVTDVDQVLGRPGRTFDSFARDYADVFGAVSASEPAPG
jgi:uncharacterized protein YbjT (DUF2867 family)